MSKDKQFELKNSVIQAMLMVINNTDELSSLGNRLGKNPKDIDILQILVEEGVTLKTTKDVQQASDGGK